VGYIALCLIVPLAWAISVAWFLNRQDRKRRAAETPPANADMYEI
jgi:hypothetical protein